MGNTGTRCMKRDSQPRCLRSKKPNISVGRSTQWAMPPAATSASCAFFVSVYQSRAIEFTTDELICTRNGTPYLRHASSARWVAMMLLR